MKCLIIITTIDVVTVYFSHDGTVNIMELVELDIECTF